MRLFIPTVAIVLIIAVTACTSGPTPTSLPTPTAIPLPTATTAPTERAVVPAPAATTVAAAKPAVTVEGFDDFFRPEKITITVGTQVTWINVGEHDHSVSFGTLFDADIKPGETFSFTFDKPGTIQYYCVPHSLSETEGMVGTITVVPGN